MNSYKTFHSFIIWMILNMSSSKTGNISLRVDIYYAIFSFYFVEFWLSRVQTLYTLVTLGRYFDCILDFSLRCATQVVSISHPLSVQSRKNFLQKLCRASKQYLCVLYVFPISIEYTRRNNSYFVPISKLGQYICCIHDYHCIPQISL